MASSSNRRGTAQTTLPWTTTEEIMLCTAWCNAMDTYVTRDRQFRKGVWEEVYDNFKKDMGGTIRGYDAIVSKWKNSIRPKVACFSVVYDSVRRMDKNGSSDLVLFQNALANFKRGMDNLSQWRRVGEFEKSSSLVRDAIISRLQKEQEKEYQLINNLLGEINRYMLQNLDRAKEETRVTSLPLDEPLKTFTLQTLRLSSVSDKRIATILEAAREKVIESINNRDKMIQTYQAI
ncbi:hypothetical protein Tco_0599369 [Tanacetum coccineum]